MNRRAQFFGTLLLLLMAGALAWVPNVAAASPQTSGADAAGKSGQSDQAASPNANSQASSNNASTTDAATNPSGEANGAPQVASASNRVVPPLYAAHRYVPLPRPKLLNVDPHVFEGSSSAAPPNAQAESTPNSSSSQDQSLTPYDTVTPHGHVAEDPTQPDSNFPPWALYDTANVDPRVKPNAGLRVPSLFPNFSPIVPDYDRTIANTRNWSVKVSLAEMGVYLDPLSSKFNEFRDVKTGAIAGVEAHYRSNNGYLNVVGRNLGRRDEDLNIDGGAPGKYLISFYDTEVPHNYMYGARSLYSGIGTGNLTISDGIRTDIQNSTSISDANAKLEAYDLQGGQLVNLDLEREKRGGEIDLVKIYPWVIKLSGSDETRNGERPWSASFGFSNFVEIPWAVHYDQDEIRLDAEWSKPESRIYFTAGFKANLFDDHVQTQTFSNPFRITDSANVVGTYDGGPAEGRMALYPTNQYYEPSSMLVVRNLPWDSTLMATLSAGFFYQDSQLQPFSTNTADTVYNTAGTPFNATDASALPRPSADASINTQALQVRWAAKPTEHLHLDTEYRVYRNAVTTPRFIISDFVREDQDVRNPQSVGDVFASLPIGYTRQTGTITALYDFGHDNRLGLSYTFESWDRRYREVKYTDDNTIKVSYDTKAKKWLDLKSFYSHTIRDTSNYWVNQWHVHEGDGDEVTALLQLRKFDEAPYIKDDAQIMATFQVGPSMSISTHLLGGKVNYNHQTFGVIDSSHQAYGIDYSYDATDRLSFFADYDYEKFHNRLSARPWDPGDPCDPWTNGGGYNTGGCNWGGIPEDTYNVAGAGLDAYLIPKKFHWTVAYTYSQSHGTQSYSGGGGPDDPFVPTNFNNVDSVTWNTLNQELEYKFNKTVALDAGYQYELWHDNDYNYVGFNYVNQYNAFNFIPGLGGSNLYMGGLLPPFYHANIAYFRLKVGL
jgi:hypothetical protein